MNAQDPSSRLQSFFEQETLLFEPDRDLLGLPETDPLLLRLPMASKAWTVAEHLSHELRFIQASQKLSQQRCDLTTSKTFRALLEQEQQRLEARQEKKIRQNVAALGERLTAFLVEELQNGRFLQNKSLIITELERQGHVELSSQLEDLFWDHTFWFGLSGCNAERITAALIERLIESEPDGLSEKILLLEQLSKGGRLKLLDGPPGSGKSKVIWAFKEIWRQSLTREQQALVICPTTVAAAELAQEIGAEAFSVTAFLQNGAVQLQQGQLVIVDEAGMIGTAEMSWICHSCAEIGALLLIVGDRQQSLPQTAGHPFRQLGQYFKFQSLTRSLRQKRMGHRRMISLLRQGDLYEAIKILDQQNMLFFSGELLEEEALADLIDFLVDQGVPLRDFMVIVNQSDRQQMVNDRLHEMLVDRGLMGRTLYEDSAKAFHAGERLQLLEDLLLEDGNVLSAGSMYFLLKEEAGSVLLSPFDEAQPNIWIKKQQLRSFNYGYVLDSHSAQGIAIKYVWLMIKQAPTLDELMNVLTRHKLDVKVFIDDKLGQRAAQFVPKIKTRQKTMLLDFFTEAQLKKIAEGLGG